MYLLSLTSHLWLFFSLQGCYVLVCSLTTPKRGSPQSMVLSHLLCPVSVPSMTYYQLHAHNSQISVSLPNFRSELQTHLSKCPLALFSGMPHGHLNCNESKTELRNQAFLIHSNDTTLHLFGHAKIWAYPGPQFPTCYQLPMLADAAFKTCLRPVHKSQASCLSSVVSSFMHSCLLQPLYHKTAQGW